LRRRKEKGHVPFDEKTRHTQEEEEEDEKKKVCQHSKENDLENFAV